MSVDVVVIGSGMAGLTCARRLHDSGLRTVVLDKGRGIGGRMATRRVTLNEGEARFDHGAQYVTARDDGFLGLLASVQSAMGDWHDGSDHPRLVGMPGMSALPRALAEGLDVRQGIEVSGLQPAPQGWIVLAEAMRIETRLVVLTVPAPQVAPLLGRDHPLADQVSRVAMDPCLTLMAAFPLGTPVPFTSRLSEHDSLAWIACDNSKPGRPAATVNWVAQASPGWSARHLEADKQDVADLMLPLLCNAIGAGPGDAVHVAAHRWRHARVTEPLGQPFLRGSCGSVYLGGDWCLGPRVEAAWQSGDAIAQDIIRSHRAA
ncbi:MAG: FAD-dependent oxidoreductase [Rhodobacterales bacterium]|nr:FAD-dependent oxidoreductase [Rhodobacterales bacterium]MDX5411554.1 FAD-dependent oxidoreductase [Rhodobacterales bacterium]